MREASCTYTTPSPPSPPSPPPLPPRSPSPPSPPPPPLSDHGALRMASAEQPSDPDCLPVSYSACVRAAEEMHAGVPTISPNVDLSQAACEGVEAETASCFLGCALGNELGVPALFTFQRASVADEFAQYMSRRCRGNAEHPFCLCATPPPPPPPYYDAATILSRDYVYAGQPISGSMESQPSGFYKPVAVDSKLPSEFVQGSVHEITCRASDSGAPQCARACAADLMGNLRAFHVTATPLPPSPPPPSSPPMPPRPPPSPDLPQSEFQFHGANDACRSNSLYTGSECRDGGVGSVYPPVCPYGSQVTLCGHRPDVGRHSAIGDDSCTTASNGQCEDGGPLTAYMAIDSEGNEYAICKFATDSEDCPVRYVEYGSLTYSNALKPPYPPSPPSHPPAQLAQLLPKPSYTHVSCSDTCNYNGTICTDGGLGAHIVDGMFLCDYGTSCLNCGIRLNIVILNSDIPPYSFNNFCDDTVQGGRAGYGTDSNDCGIMKVQRTAGVPRAISNRQAVGRRLQGRASTQDRPLPSPTPPPPPSPLPHIPPPPPSPPEGLDRCECACYGESGSSTYQGDMEWGPIALNAMATTPSENTVLYSAYPIVGRGGTVNVEGIRYATGLNNGIDRYIKIKSISARAAHIASGWEVDNGSSAWANRVWWGAPVVWADEWHQDASRPREEWRDRCVSYCVEKATHRYQLAYVQVDIQDTAWNGSHAFFYAACSCFETSSPKLPSDAEATEWLGQNTVHVSSKVVDIYVVRANHPRQRFVDTLAATVNYEQAYHDGIYGALTAWHSSLESNLDACVDACASSSYTSLKGLSFESSTTNCSCYNADPAIDTSFDELLQYNSSTTKRYYSASVCPRTRPGPEEDSFAWDDAEKSWCPGHISEDHLGVAAIGGTVYSHTSSSSDYGTECASTCVQADGCSFAELMVTPWNDLAGAIPIDPPPHPSPPSHPPNHPPPLNPSPPGSPTTDDIYWRTWFPTGNEFPTDSDGDGYYEVTCGVSSCGGQIPIFEGSVGAALELARQLETDGTFHETLCPWEWYVLLLSNATPSWPCRI